MEFQNSKPLDFVVAIQVLQNQFRFFLGVNLCAVCLECAFAVCEGFIRKNFGLMNKANDLLRNSAAGWSHLLWHPMNTPSWKEVQDPNYSLLWDVRLHSLTLVLRHAQMHSYVNNKERNNSGCNDVGCTFSRSHSTQLYTTTCPGFSANCSIYLRNTKEPQTSDSSIFSICLSDNHSAYTSNLG